MGEKATVRYGPIGIPRGPPGALRGALGAISNFSQISGLGPGPFSWKVSVVALGEQAVPIEQKRHGHVAPYGDGTIALIPVDVPLMSEMPSEKCSQESQPFRQFTINEIARDFFGL